MKTEKSFFDQNFKTKKLFSIQRLFKENIFINGTEEDISQCV